MIIGLGFLGTGEVELPEAEAAELLEADAAELLEAEPLGANNGEGVEGATTGRPEV